jgi:hypothetical protein
MPFFALTKKSMKPLKTLSESFLHKETKKTNMRNLEKNRSLNEVIILVILSLFRNKPIIQNFKPM